MACRTTTAVVKNEVFRQRYPPNPVQIDYLPQNAPLYIRDDSVEAGNLERWQATKVTQ